MERAELKELIREVLNEVIEERIHGRNPEVAKPHLTSEEHAAAIIRECPIVVETRFDQCESTYEWCRENVGQFAFRAYPECSGDWNLWKQENDKFLWRFRNQSDADALIQALAEGEIKSEGESV